MIAAVLQELVEQETICSVDLDTIETGIERIPRRAPERHHDLRYFERVQRMRRLVGRLLKCRRVRETRRSYRRRRDGQAAVRAVARMRPASMVNDLKHDPATLRVNGLGDRAPTGNLFWRI